MVANPNNAPVLLTRRSLLRATAEAAGVAFILGARAETATASPKLSLKVVAYQDHPAGDKRCDGCAHFQPPNGCKIVDGIVSPGGYCKFFTPRSQA
jgi:hypothetical protein